MRINKFLSAIGFCSRRQADEYLKLGYIATDKRKLVLGDDLKEGEGVYYKGSYVGRLEELADKPRTIVMLNKPVGIVCSSSGNDRAENVVDFVNYPGRIYPIGRLDKDSEGLLLLTDDGSLVNAIMKAANYHEKEYIVDVDKDIDEKFIAQMSKGVYLSELKQKTRACKLKKLSKRRFIIILTQGLNRQIRRMCDKLGYKVTGLKRIRIMNIRLGHLEKGKYRLLSDEEIKELDRLISKSKI